MMTSAEQDNLKQCLLGFIEKVNSHTRMKFLLKDWEPTIVIDTTDTEAAYSLVVKGSRVADLVEGTLEADHCVQLQAESEVLMKIFSGKLNPARAHMDGQLAAYGSDRDQVKLDAISLILWGI